MKVATEPTFTIDLFMAGDIAQAKQVCREFCLQGLCVHIHPTDYIYTGGEEAGFKIGLLNYPRFPVEPRVLWHTAVTLAEMLIQRLHQRSALLVGPEETVWLTRESAGEPR